MPERLPYAHLCAVNLCDSIGAIIELTMRIVVDTNVLLGALLRQGGPNRKVLRACLEHRLLPYVGLKLFLEYEDVLARERLFRNCPLNAAERQQLFAAFLSVAEWTEVHYLWRPNLRDERDNHLMELAVAASAEILVTNNLCDFRNAELHFPSIRVLSPSDCLEVLK